MDEVRAHAIAERLMGTSVGGWQITEYIGAGKSALVLKAIKHSEFRAIKIFDPELVEKFGRDTQLGRIERELSLVGANHNNLIAIYEGGVCDSTDHLFIVMDYIKAPNLSDSLSLVPRERISAIISQVASAAEFLEIRELAHRDIKPANIAILPDFSRAVLLDLGVVRPFGDPKIQGQALHRREM